MTGVMEVGSSGVSTSDSNVYRNHTLQAKHKVFLSHSGAQKGFVEQLCVDLERCDRHPFLDKRRDCLPVGKDFPSLIFDAIEQCEVGVAILSEEFLTSKWPMLELVALTNAKKKNPSLTIMPVLLGITLDQWCDRNNHKRWLSTWQVWADSDKRIDVKEWESVLQLSGPTVALKYNAELGEVKFREEIVEEICKLVPSETRFEDSYVQGRSRLCKVIREKLMQSDVSRVHGVRAVGLYGVGGIGKTTICKAMCNDLSTTYRGKVAHVELESRDEYGLLKEVLRRLTDTKLELSTVDECRYRLARDMMNAGVFLAIDNVSSATKDQARTLLRANYGPGSVVLVTARSLEDLTSLQIEGRACMEMPELESEEAKALFLYHAACVPPTYSVIEAERELISACVRQCYFRKDGGLRYHYHPLALQTLGEQLGRVGYVPQQWWALLNEINFFNPSHEPKHSIFSILRKSFDALNAQEQLLFMDAALFVPYSIGGYEYDLGYKWNVFEWFAMVHGIPVDTVINRLKNLKAKSLVENLGDGFSRVGMHDLWREFARQETKVGNVQERRWVFEWDEYNTLEEAIVTSGDGSWVNLRRMFFLERGFAKLEEVNFGCFPNVTVLKLSRSDASPLELDLSCLKQLRSLELERKEVPVLFVWQRKSTTSVGLVGLGSLSKLGFLRWSNIPSDSPCIDEIGRLTNLQVLDLFGGGRLPDLSSLVLLRVACFRENAAAETVTGLSSKHIHLRCLDFNRCSALRCCPGVGELVALQDLRFFGCSNLKEVPNLQKLKRLRTLIVRGCSLITALPGLNDLVGLQELDAGICENLAELPDLRNLRNLRKLDIGSCGLIRSLPGLDELVCLQSLRTWGCEHLTRLPDMCKLTNLRVLELYSYCPLQSAAGLGDLISLRTLYIGFDKLHDWPDLSKLTKLEKLNVSGWQADAFSSLASFVFLESVSVRNCKGLKTLPDLHRLTRVQRLEFWSCEFENMSGLRNVTKVKDLQIMDCDKLEAIPDLSKLVRLESLMVVRCALLRDFRGVLAAPNLRYLHAGGHPWLGENLGSDIGRLTSLRLLDVTGSGFTDLQALGACSQLHTLDCGGCLVEELPDLAKFPGLIRLDVQDCEKLTKLICTRPLSSKFAFLNVQGCKSLRNLPDFSKAETMRELNVANCGVKITPRLIKMVKASWPNVHLVTNLPADEATAVEATCR